MSISPRKQTGILAVVCSMLISAITLSACGGGGGSDTTAGIGGTGIVAGKITNFGSIYVNGGIFNTDQSQFIVDGDATAGLGDLSVGMVVLLRVDFDTGKAIDVVYDDEIQGPVATAPFDVVGSGGTKKTFDVFGQTVTIDDIGTIFEATTFGNLMLNDVVEISGFRTSPGTITATYVRWIEVLDPNNSEVELRGVISGYAGGTSFQIDGSVINFDGTTEIEVPNVLVNGLYVEVEGVIQADLSVQADKIEYEDEDFGDEVDEVSLQGIISNYISDANFEIDGQAIDAGSAQFLPTGTVLGNGLEVEIEGDIVVGVLIADELEVREGEAKLKAVVSSGSVDPGNSRFEINYFIVPGAVVINVDAQTVFEDEVGAIPLENMSINDLMDNDFVKIEGQEVNGAVIASTVKRIDPEDYKLEGEVDSFVLNTSITILGIPFPVDPNLITPPGTEFEGFPDSAAFFGALNPAGGDIVEIEDNVPADGVADEVELD